jgi:hypothetical protein
LIERENVVRSFGDTSRDTNKSLEIATMQAGQAHNLKAIKFKSYPGFEPVLRLSSNVLRI